MQVTVKPTFIHKCISHVKPGQFTLGMGGMQVKPTSVKAKERCGRGGECVCVCVCGGGGGGVREKEKGGGGGETENSNSKTLSVLQGV